MASITKHRSKWSVRYRDNGKNLRKSFDTKADAERFADGLKVTTEPSGSRTSPFLKVCEPTFINWSNRRDRAANTLDRDKQCLKVFYDAFPADKQVHTVTTKEVLHYLDRYNSKKSSTYNKAYFAIKAYFEAVKEAGYIDHNPIDFKPKRQRSLMPDLLSDDDIANLIAAFDEYDRPLAEFVATTGCRINEALTLTWDCIKNNRITFTNTKERKDKIVYIPQQLLERIEANRIENCTLVFPNRWGLSRQNNIRRCIDRAAKRAGIKSNVHWHVLRHSAATRMVMAAPLPVVQAVLGHRNISTTQKYIHVAGQQLQEISNGIMTQFWGTTAQKVLDVTTRKAASKAASKRKATSNHNPRVRGSNPCAATKE